MLSKVNIILKRRYKICLLKSIAKSKKNMKSKKLPKNKNPNKKVVNSLTESHNTNKNPIMKIRKNKTFAHQESNNYT